ncbi:MAG: hypothetical protein KDG52_08150 [Rhodocyclaceae bacterium]|nr:hypothetical protein [Rhodocyclaceae bacterium]
MRFVTPILALLLAGMSSAATAQWQRLVVVNGQRLGPNELATLDRMHCARIADGAYWFDLRSGAWGYAGSPVVRGRLGDPCRLAGSQRRPSLSERGLLYTPGDRNFR